MSPNDAGPINLLIPNRFRLPSRRGRGLIHPENGSNPGANGSIGFGGVIATLGHRRR